MNTSRTLSSAALAVASASLLAVPAAHAGTASCTYNPKTQNVNAKLTDGGFEQLIMEGNKVVVFGANGKTVCTSSTGIVATRFNTDTIFMNGSFSTKDDFIVSYAGGAFKPGVSGGSDPSRMEIIVFNDSQDLVDISGSDAPDLITINGGVGSNTLGGVRVNGDVNSAKTDILFPQSNPSLLRVHGLGGSDFITGGSTFGAPATMRLELWGDDGEDWLAGGLLGGDALHGENGNDTLDTKEGQAGDSADGGFGFDSAYVDSNDTFSSIEKFLVPIGKPSLSQTPLKRGKTTVRLSWEHPQAWKQLRSVTLEALSGNTLVGQIAMTPGTGAIKSSGALSLNRATQITHVGRTVSAKLALKVAKSAAKAGLRLQLKAVDQAGNAQIEAFPGLDA